MDSNTVKLFNIWLNYGLQTFYDQQTFNVVVDKSNIDIIKTIESNFNTSIWCIKIYNKENAIYNVCKIIVNDCVKVTKIGIGEVNKTIHDINKNDKIHVICNYVYWKKGEISGIKLSLIHIELC